MTDKPTRKTRTVLTQDQLNELAELSLDGATFSEMAAILGIDKSTLSRNPKYREVIDRSRAHLNVQLRKTQIRLALGGDVAMLKWLGRALLGQDTEQAPSVTVNVGEREEIDVVQDADNRINAAFEARKNSMN